MKLEGIRVLDLSLFRPGPVLTQTMADHGAKVIKLGPVSGGEPNREIDLKRDGATVYFANSHRNKKIIQLGGAVRFISTFFAWKGSDFNRR